MFHEVMQPPSFDSINTVEVERVVSMTPADENTFVTTIVDALTKRDFVYQRVTNTVASKIDFVFEAIVEYINESALEISWDTINANNDLLIISAKVPGLNPTQQRVITVGIPLTVVQYQSKDKIIEFFTETESKRKQHEVELAQFAKVTFDEDVDLDDEFDDNDVEVKRKPIPFKPTLH